MQSLKRKSILWDDAKRASEQAKQRAAAARTGQVARSTVDVYGEAAPLDVVFEGAVDTAEVTAEQDEAIFVLDEDQTSQLHQFLDGDGSDIEDILDAGDLGMEGAESDADRWAEYDESATETHDAHMDAIETNERVALAQAAADQAFEEALKAGETADGKNRIYAGKMEPAVNPDAPFVQGDLWYVTDEAGRMVSVRIWDGTIWAKYQFVADSVLVPGSVGGTVIKDGAIATQQLAATAIDGMTITGALVRTAASGARAQMTNDGFEVLSAASSPLVRMGFGIDTGMAVRDESSGSLVPLAAHIFGAYYIMGSSVITCPWPTSTGTWGTNYVSGLMSGTFSTGTGRLLVVWGYDNLKPDVNNFGYSMRMDCRLYRASDEGWVATTGTLESINEGPTMDFEILTGLPKNVPMQLKFVSAAKKLFDQASGPARMGRRRVFIMPV